MGTAEILITAGVVAVLGAVVGGGLKGFGVEVPLLASVKRQVALVLVGVGLLGLGLFAPVPPRADGKSAAPKQADAAGAPVANMADASVPAESPQPQGPPGAPDILGMGFPEARRLIVAAGWSPIMQEAAPRDNPALGLRGEEVEASGYREAATCSGSGSAPCLLRYRQRNHVLEVVVLGDKLESGIVDMYEVLGCNARYPPEGCPAKSDLAATPSRS